MPKQNTKENTLDDNFLIFTRSNSWELLRIFAVIKHSPFPSAKNKKEFTSNAFAHIDMQQAIWSLLRKAIENGEICLSKGSARSVPMKWIKFKPDQGNLLVERDSFLGWYRNNSSEIDDLIPEGWDNSYRKNLFKKVIAAKSAGKRPSSLKASVIEEVIKIREEKGITSAPKIARMSQITKKLAPGASHAGLKDISKDEYEKRFGRKLGTVENWIRDGFKLG